MRFWGLLVALVVLYVWRLSGIASFDPVTDHLSNLYLSGGAVLLAAGPNGHRTRALVVAGALAAVNVVGEAVLPVLGIDDEVNEVMGDANTSDPVDALFGLAGIGAVLAVLPLRRSATIAS